MKIVTYLVPKLHLIRTAEILLNVALNKYFAKLPYYMKTHTAIAEQNLHQTIRICVRSTVKLGRLLAIYRKQPIPRLTQD